MLFSLMLKSDCHFRRHLNLKISNVKLEVWEVNINPLTSSVFFFVFYIYSKLTSKSIINPLSACLLLKQCWTRLAAMTHLVRCTHVHPTGYQNPQQLCENELKSVKNSLFFVHTINIVSSLLFVQLYYWKPFNLGMNSLSVSFFFLFLNREDVRY